MDGKEHADATSSPQSFEGSYTGALASTLREVLLLRQPDGSMREASVYTRVNVVEAPHLRQSVFDGVIHMVDGQRLALPLVYHDPRARKFALLLPEALRHRVLEERAELLLRLGEAKEHLPAYVASAQVVVGLLELDTYLRADARAQSHSNMPSAPARDLELERRLEDLSHRERQLWQQHEDLIRRERELDMRARQMDRKSTWGASSMPGARRDNVAVEGSSRFPIRPSSPAIPIPRGGSDASEVLEAELDEVSGEEPLYDYDSSAPNAFDEAFEQSADSLRAGEASASDVEDLGVVRSREEEEEILEKMPTYNPPATGSHAVLSDVEGAQLERMEDLVDPSAVEEVAAVLSSTGFVSEATLLEEPELDVVLLLDDDSRDSLEASGEPFVRVCTDLPSDWQADQFARAADLLTQLVIVDDYPVVLVTVYARHAHGQLWARRVALDPYGEQDGALLEALSSRFAVDFVIDGDEEASRAIVASREENVQRILAYIEEMPSPQVTSFMTAADTVLQEPPAVECPTPTFEAGEPLERPGAIRRALVAWSAWKELADEAVLLYGLSPGRVDAASAPVLEAAGWAGVLTTEASVEEALRSGQYRSLAVLVEQQVHAFSLTLATDKDGGSGLSRDEIVEICEELLDLADDAQVRVGADFEALTRQYLGADGEDESSGEHAIPEDVVADDAESDSDADAGQFASVEPNEDVEALMQLLESDMSAARAIEQLCEHDDVQDLGRVFAALQGLPLDQRFVLAPMFAQFGSRAVDTVAAGLEAKAREDRLLSVLLLGELREVESLPVLVAQLERETTPVWKQVARVIGTFGEAALAPLKRGAVSAEGGLRDRITYTLAHVANAIGTDAETELLAWVAGSDALSSDVVLEALALRGKAEDDAKTVRAGAAHTEGVEDLAQSFYTAGSE